MTIVEFFDGVSMDNMASCLAIKPDKVIFIGVNTLMEKQKAAYSRLAESHGLNVEFEYREIPRNNIKKITEVLSDIAENEEECIFDLTGGEDLVLVAMGIVFERYKNTRKLQMHRFNIKECAIYDCDNDGVLPDIKLPEISCADNITLYGGSIVPYDGEKGTYDWDFNDGFKNDIKNMWEICKRNPGLWNSQITTIYYIVKASTVKDDNLCVSASKKNVEARMKADKYTFTWVHGIAKALSQKGLINNLEESDEIISFAFKNEQIKMCLTKEGTVLELIVLLFAQSVKDKNGSLMFDDALNGAYIDWDAVLHKSNDDVKDTENEIDVILMKGLMPVFISCKNGYFDETELYKLDTVAKRFGGPYVRKVLIATYFGKNNFQGHKYFEQRAKDMDIKLIEKAHELNNEEFVKAIKEKCS